MSERESARGKNTDNYKKRFVDLKNSRTHTRINYNQQNNVACIFNYSLQAQLLK